MNVSSWWCVLAALVAVAGEIADPQEGSHSRLLLYTNCWISENKIPVRVL